ncbi:MAG: hypothetical protein AAGA83_25470 [Cyanobacteria bacterium P01_F01_bin.116]
MRSIWMAWTTPWWRPEIETWLRKWQTLPIEESWPEIKSVWETHQSIGEVCPLAAAAGLAVRILSFSGICRDTPGSGALNIKWNKSQLKRWHPSLRKVICGEPTGEIIKAPHPHHTEWLADLQKGRESVSVLPGFLSYRLHKPGYTPEWPKQLPTCFQMYEDYGQVQYPDDTSKTLSFCDPPYAGDICDPPPTRRSGRYITPAYYGHRPHAQFTYDMAVHSVRAALAAGCHTIIACNYDSDRLHGDYLALASEFGYQCDLTILGELKTLNNNARTVEQATPYQDTYWVFSRVGNG